MAEILISTVSGIVLLIFGADAVVRACLQALGTKGTRAALVFSLALATVGSILPEVFVILQTDRLEDMIVKGRIYVPVEFGAWPEEVPLSENSTEPGANKWPLDKLTSLQSELKGRVTTSIPAGLIFGSSLVNLLLVVGIAGLRFGRPLPISRPALFRDAIFLLIGLVYAGIVVAKVNIGVSGWDWGEPGSHRSLGGAGLALALAYVLAVMTTGAPAAAQAGKAEGAAAQPSSARARILPTAIPGYLYFIGGLIALWQGSSLIIGLIAEHIMYLRAELGAGETGSFGWAALVYVLALGVAIPEIVAASLIARRDEPDLALGTVLAATVLNLLAGLGLAVWLFGGFPGFQMVDGASITNPVCQFSIDWIVLAVAVLFTTFFCLSGRELSTGESLMLIVLFLAYFAFRLLLPVREGLGTVPDWACQLVTKTLAAGGVGG